MGDNLQVRLIQPYHRLLDKKGVPLVSETIEPGFYLEFTADHFKWGCCCCVISASESSCNDWSEDPDSHFHMLSTALTSPFTA